MAAMSRRKSRRESTVPSSDGTTPPETPPTEPDVATVEGVAKFARPGDNAARSLKPGDIAVVDLTDIDRSQAEALVARQVRAVVNAGSSSTGAYPNLGPSVLAEAGVLLVDRVGQRVFADLRSGDRITIREGAVMKGDKVVARGRTMDDAAVSASLGAAEQGLSTQLGSLTANAADHLERERAMLLEGARVPRLAKRLRGRPVVVVSTTYDWQDDLTSLKRFLRERDPVVIAVGDAADELLSRKIRPHVVLGPVDTLSDRALRSGADVIATSGAGQPVGHERFEKAEVDVHTFVAAGQPSDLAIVVAEENDAPVIVQVGQPKDLVQFLERGAAEVASSFVTRLRASRRLVDAAAVAQLNARSVSAWPILLLLVVSVAAVAVALASTPVGQEWFASLTDALPDLRTRLEGLLP